LKYVDFVDLSYKPTPSDITCTFYLEPEDIVSRKQPALSPPKAASVHGLNSKR
jgi:hypothetical protein